MRRFLFAGEGRLDRLGYLFALFMVAVLFVAPVALTLPGAVRTLQPEARQTYRDVVTVVGGICWLVVLWIYCATTSRRLHDMNLSGWLTLLALLPVIGLGAMTLLLLAAPGSAGSNRHGPKWL